jgi:uncharacterized protein (UPF0332 family)
VTSGAYDPVGFFHIAQRLQTLGNDEGYRRTAVSRAYYACFHVALAACVRKWSWAPPDFGQHRGVAGKLREQRQPLLSKQLLALLDLRERADYDLDAPIDELTCREALDLAAWLLPRLQAL